MGSGGDCGDLDRGGSGGAAAKEEEEVEALHLNIEGAALHKPFPIQWHMEERLFPRLLQAGQVSGPSCVELGGKRASTAAKDRPSDDLFAGNELAEEENIF